MEYKFCPDCGSKLEHRNLGDEKNVPWCVRCEKPWFPIFSVATIALVYDENNRVLLLQQKYIHPVYRNLVSGYIQPGERAEETAVREIREETGLETEHLEFCGTWWFERKQMMMIGYMARVKSGELKLSKEVDDAEWVDAAEAPKLVHQRPESVSQILTSLFCERIL